MHVLKTHTFGSYLRLSRVM